MIPAACPSLARLRARRIAAEDLHGRVFAQACNLILATPGGADLVKTLDKTFREMLHLTREEMELVANGKVEARLVDQQL